MAVWHERASLYKFGFIGVVVSTVIFIVGFCSPAWVQSEWDHQKARSFGLWQVCTVDLSACKVSIDDTNPGWLKAVRALESVSMFFSVVACIIGLYCNCILKAQMSSVLFNRNVETSAIVSMIFGSFGLIIFAIQVQRSYDDVQRYSWAFFLVCIGQSLMCISAFVMMVSGRIQAAWARQHLIQRHRPDLSFTGTGALPDFVQSDRVYITSMEEQMDMGPPAYETVVNCIPQEEPAPPPYDQVARMDG